MRSGHIAWIGAVITFVAVVAVSMWNSGQFAQQSQPVVQASKPEAAPQAVSNAAAFEHGPTDPVQPEFEPPEDARSMMDAAHASPDADVRDEATALSSVMDAESAPPSE